MRKPNLKMKREASPARNKPNAILHMALWGIGSGITIETLFMIWLWRGQGFFSFYGSYTNQLILNLIFGFVLGGVPGIILGWLSGWTLSQVMKEALVPYSWEEVQNYRLRAYIFVGLVTGISSSIMILWLSWLWAGSGASVPLEFFLIALIAAILSVVAAPHYMFRLRLWSEEAYGIQREKVKKPKALEDKINTEEHDFDEEESKKHETS